MSVFAIEVVKRQLRDYYNEVVEILEQLGAEEMSFDESERALIHLDEKYAEIITKGLRHD